MNKIFLTGRVAKTPETRTTTTGKNVTSFNLAITRKYKNASGDYGVDFISCKAFSKTGELINQYCSQGDLIGIEGSIRTGSYTDKNGNKRYTTDVMVENVEFLKKKSQKSQLANGNTRDTQVAQNDTEDIFADFAEEISIEDDEFLD